MNHQGARFQLKILFTVLLKKKVRPKSQIKCPHKESKTWHFWHCEDRPGVPTREKKLLKIINDVYLKNSLGVGLVQGDRKYGLYSIKTITPMESPYKDSWPDVCVCVCRLSGQAPDRDSLAWLHSNVKDVMSLLQHIPSAPSALPEVSEHIDTGVKECCLFI